MKKMILIDSTNENNDIISSKKNDRRFRKFRSLFESLNIIKELGDKLTFWSYEKLNETNRVALKIKELLK